MSRSWRRLRRGMSPLAHLGPGPYVHFPIFQSVELIKIKKTIAYRLLTRLPRMPFPASSSSATSSSGGGGAADDFDLSSTLSRTTTLQAQVSTNTASARLLQRQIARERAALRRDERELKALREGFRQSQALRRRKERGLHPLAAKVDAELDVSGMTGDDASEVVERRNALSGIPVQATTTVVGSSSSLSSGFGYFDTNENTPPNLDTVEPDSDLDPLLDQLRSHLLSMRNNTASMAPVLDAVDGAKLALDKFSARNLDEAALRRLYGGP